MREAEAIFPQLAPIRMAREPARDAWRVVTRRGYFMFDEYAIGHTRRAIVEFFVHSLQQIVRRAEYEDEQQHRGDREWLPTDALQPRFGNRIALHVGDRITVNGNETRIVAITPNEITVERLDARGLVDVRRRCGCPDCRERDAREAEQLQRDRNDQMRRQLEHQYDALRYAMPMAFDAEPRPITREAEQTAIALLRRALTPEQLQMWDREHAIEVQGGHTGRRYRIRGQIAAYNIDVVGGGRLCCSPGYPGQLPLGDYVLGQKLALELDEERFLNAANYAAHAGDPGLPGAGRRIDTREPAARTTTADLDRLFRENYAAQFLIPPL